MSFRRYSLFNENPIVYNWKPFKGDFKIGSHDPGKAVEQAVKDAPGVIAGFTVGFIIGGPIGGVIGAGLAIEAGGEELFDVMTGQYHSDAKDIEKAQERYEESVGVVDAMSLDLARIAVFFDEIYSMSKSNEIDDYVNETLNPLEAQLQRMINDFNNNYGSIMKLQGTFLGKAFLSPFMIIGGIVFDVGNMIRGDMEATMRIIGLIVSIVLLVVTFGTDVNSWAAIVSYIAFYISLDASFGGGGITMFAMQILDFVFNDVLTLDDYASDFSNFDSGSKRYEETMGYFQLGLSITALIVSLDFSSIGNSGKDVANAANNTKTVASAAQGANSSEAATKAAKTASDTKNLTDLLNAVNMATGYFQSKMAHDALKQELNNKLAMVQDKQDALDKKHRYQMLMMEETFMTNHQERVLNYETSLDSGIYYYKDPMYLVPMSELDSRNKHTKDDFEDMFSDDLLAGSDKYFHNMIYSQQI